MSRGGADHVGNLALVCGQCDRAKRNMTPGDLLVWALRILILAVVASVRGLFAVNVDGREVY